MVARHILGIEYYPVLISGQVPILGASLEVVHIRKEGMQACRIVSVLVLMEKDFSNQRIAGTEMNLELLFALLECIMSHSVLEVNV
jgi:hypothetical protein